MQNLHLSIERTGGNITLAIEKSSGGGGHAAYPGPYEVEPHYYDQELATRGLIMNQNVLVNEIYVGRVTNPSGGNTVTIGV